MTQVKTGFALKCHRAIFSIPLAVLSLVILILTIITAFQCVRYMDSDFFTSNGPILAFSERVFYTIATLTLVAIPAATFGFSSFFVRYNVLAFGFVLFIIAPLIGFAIIGADLKSISDASEGGIKQHCPTDKTKLWESPNEKFNDLFKNHICDFDNGFGPVVSKWMCSEQCPCDFTDAKEQAKYKKLKHAELTSFERCGAWPEFDATPTQVAGKPDSDARRLQAAGVCKSGDKREPIIFPAAVNAPVVKKPAPVSKDGTPELEKAPFSSFRQCFEGWHKDWKAEGSKKGEAPSSAFKKADGSLWQQRAQADFEFIASKQHSFEFVTYMNFNLGCSGVCNDEALFFFDRNTFELPDKTCDLEIETEFDLNASRLIALLATCWIIMAVATCFAIILLFDFTTGGMDTLPRQEWARKQMAEDKKVEAKQAIEEELETRPLVANAENNNVTANLGASDINLLNKQNKVGAAENTEA